VQTRPRNEALDCLVYALAAMRLSGRPLDIKPEPAPTGRNQGEGTPPANPIKPTKPANPHGDWNFERRT
jgi:phage terminase large subunit GpA-like protein